MLFAVLLGGKHPQAKIEVHDIAFVVADTLEAAYPQLRQQWFGNSKGVHIDAWMEIHGVEHWKVELSPLAPRPSDPRLYFINLGGYDPRIFGEAHSYGLVVAHTTAEAKLKSRALAQAQWAGKHLDALMDVDDCIAIDEVSGRYVHLTEAPHAGVTWQNTYLMLPA